MGGVVRVACQGFLVREACVGVLVDGAGFLFSGVQWSDQYWVMRRHWFWRNFKLPKAQGCVPVLLENLHSMSCSGTCWPLGGA